MKKQATKINQPTTNKQQQTKQIKTATTTKHMGQLTAPGKTRVGPGQWIAHGHH